MTPPDLAIVVPVSRRADDLGRVLDHLREGLEGTGKSYEVIMVVDGELPQRLEEARALAEQHENLRVLRFARRFGEGAALQAGLHASETSVLVTHPAYFEVQADVLGRLVAALESGADFAFASRLPQSDSLFNRLQRRCFNALVRGLLGVRCRDVACGVRALSRETLEDISMHGVFHRFITAAAIMRGFEVREVDAALHPQARRSRPYGPLTYLRRILDIANVFFVTKFLHKPLRFFGMIGGLLLIPGLLITGYMSVLRILGQISLGERPLFLFGVILTVLGFQIVAVGLLGEIISFSQAARSKPYRIREVIRKRGRADPQGKEEVPSPSSGRRMADGG